MPNEFKVRNGLIVASSGSTVLSVDGASGRLFSVDDSLSGSLFSVNTAAGLPVMEAFSDNTVRIGQFGRRVLFVSQSFVGIGKEASLNTTLDVSGSFGVTGSIFLPSLISTPTNTNVVTINVTTGQLGYTASAAFGGGGSGVSGGATNYIPLFTSATSLSSSILYQSASNVGIGTTSPSQKFHVEGRSLIQGDAGYLFDIQENSANKVRFQVYVDANEVDLVSGYDTTAKPMRLYTANTPRIHIAIDGNVGIGTTNPGYKLEVNGSTRITGSLAIGNITPSATAGRIDASNDIVAFSTSDSRFKINVKPIENALSKVEQISGVEFDWLENPIHHGNKGHDIGVIAQELEQVLPEVVTTRDSGYKAVKYDKIVALLIQAVKEQQAEINELKAKINGITE